jgi:hypothetical protein
MTSFTVIYDACVLYPAPLRDFLMRLALTDLYRAKMISSPIFTISTRKRCYKRQQRIGGV